MDKGQLELVWPHPGPAEAADYRCDVTALTNHGRSFVFTQTLSVSEEEVSMQDLVTHLQKAELDKQNLQKTLDSQTKTFQVMNSTVENQAKTIQQMNYTIDNQAKVIKSLLKSVMDMSQSLFDLSRKIKQDKQNLQKMIDNQAEVMTSLLQSNVKLNQSLTDLYSKVRLEPDVFFSTVAQSGWVDENTPSVFYSPISNQGSSFDNTTGVFTAPISGFYHFELHVFSDADYAYFNIDHNGVAVVSVEYLGDDGWRGPSTSVYLKLGQGDKVSAEAVNYSYVSRGSRFQHRLIFSGMLVALA